MNKAWGPIILIAAVTFAAYLPSLHNGFTNWDDNILVTENRKITSLSAANLKEIFISVDNQHYHPLVTLSFALEHTLAGLNPALYHADSLSLHVLNCLLVFWIVLLLCGNGFAALAAALLWGTNPMHVESVAWVTERKDLLYSFFFLSGLAAYVFYRKENRESGYRLALLFFILSCFCKAMAVTFPAVLLLLDHYFAGSPSRSFLPGSIFAEAPGKTGKSGKKPRSIPEANSSSMKAAPALSDWKTWKEKVPFALISAVFIIINIKAQVPGEAAQKLSFTYLDRLFFPAYITAFQAVKSFFPFSLSAIYPYPVKTGNLLPPVFYLLSPLLAALGFILYKFRAETGAVIYCLLFFVICLSPVIQFVPLPGPSITYDRYNYIPSIGLFIIAGLGLAWLNDKKSRTAGAAALFLASCVFSVSTWEQCQVWKDSVSLWNAVLAKHPFVAVAHNNRGNALLKNKEYEKALEDFNEALAIKPEYADAYYNRGNAWRDNKDYGRAVSDFSEAIRLNPTNEKAYNNRGNVYFFMGEADRALADLSEAISLNPDFAQVYNNRAVIYLQKGEIEKARQDIERMEKLGLQPSPDLLRLLAR